MKVYIFKNKNEGSKYLAERIIELVKKNPSTDLGLASGKTFMTMYKLLGEDHKNNGTDWSNVKTYNLDEFENTNGTEKFSCKKYMHDNLFDYININKSNIWFPTVINVSKETLSKDDDVLESVKIPFQLLGVGRNGHIGFNEPDSPANCNTRKVQLTDSTIEDKANLFCDGNKSEIPSNAVTVGVNKIQSARKIVVVAFGSSKTNALKHLLSNDIMTKEYPLTYMKSHKDVEVIIDEECFDHIKPLASLEIIKKY